MQTQTEMQREVDEAVRTMRAGGIILYPTDTVWDWAATPLPPPPWSGYTVSSGAGTRNQCSCCAPRPT